MKKEQLNDLITECIAEVLTESNYTKNWAERSNYKGIAMELVGSWMDLAAYYRGSDGNYWAYQTSWSNMGPTIQNLRGKTLTGEPITSLPPLKQAINEHEAEGMEPDVITAARRIVSNNHCEKVLDPMGDNQSVEVSVKAANLLVKVYEALSSDNRLKFASQSIPTMVPVAESVAKKLNNQNKVTSVNESAGYADVSSYMSVGIKVFITHHKEIINSIAGEDPTKQREVAELIKAAFVHGWKSAGKWNEKPTGLNETPNGQKFVIKVECVDGDSEEAFNTKEEAAKYILGYLTGGDARSVSQDGFGTDYCNFHFDGFTFKDLGIDIRKYQDY